MSSTAVWAERGRAQLTWTCLPCFNHSSILVNVLVFIFFSSPSVAVVLSEQSFIHRFEMPLDHIQKNMLGKRRTAILEMGLSYWLELCQRIRAVAS